MRHSFLLLCAIFLIASPVFSQDVDKWLRIKFKDKKLSVAVPKKNIIIDAGNRDRNQKLRVVAFENGVEIEVIHRKPNFLPGFFSSIDDYPDAEKETLYFDDVTVVKTSPVLFQDKKIHRSLTIIEKKNFYTLIVRCKPEAEKKAERFFLSIKIGDKSLIVKDKEMSFQEDTVDASSLKTSPEIIAAEKRKTGNFDGEITYEPKDMSEKIPETENLEHRALIVEKPYPRYSSSTGFTLATEKLYVRLKVQFRADGQIGDIVVLSSDDNKGFTENSVNAARRIKFVPAQRNGSAVESFQVIEYSMTGVGDPNFVIR